MERPGGSFDVASLSGAARAEEEARRGRVLRSAAAAVLVWSLVVAAVIGGRRSHGEILLVFGAGAVVIGAVVLAALWRGGEAASTGVLPGAGSATGGSAGPDESPHRIVSSGLFERHPELHPLEPSRFERGADRLARALPGPSARSRQRHPGRRSSSYDPRVAMVILSLYFLARLLILCGVSDAAAVTVAGAAGILGGAIYWLRPTKVRTTAQAYARWRVRRGGRV